jgi:hypothetical protein
MNEHQPRDWMWFKGEKGTVGIVKYRTPEDAIEYRISVVDGFMEKMDVLQLIAWGAPFPKEAGIALFGDEERE